MSVSNAFGALIASGILGSMEGKLGRAAWRYNTTISLLLIAPPSIFTAIFSNFFAHHSDKTQERFWHLTGSAALGIFGFIISATTMNIAARYISMYVADV
jgi:hypothetical protein